MANLPEQRRSRWFLPEFSDLFTGFPSFPMLRPFFENQFFESHLIRIEDEVEDGHYVIRAELPGIDPEKDVDITVRDRRLTIKAERTEKKEAKGRSEFSYGSFVRSITLPPGANEEDIKATYDKGILTVSVAVPQQAAASGEKHITIQTAG